MKRIEPESIGDVLRLTLQESQMTGRLDECRAVALWPQLMGSAIADKTSRPSVSSGIMTVYVDSSVLRQELNMNRSRIIRMINEKIGKEVIRDLRFK